MFKTIYREFNKDKYIKEIKYKSDKSIQITYIHQSKFKPKYLINNNHIFHSGGYRTILTSDTKNETINPLDLTSQYPVEKFQTAIESKVIKDVFSNLETNKLDIMKLLAFANLFGLLILIYYQVIGG